MWHRLDPWPDSVPGLLRLKRTHIISPLSNGATQLLVNMAKRAGIPWDLILSSDVTRAYKRDPRAYQAAISALGMEPHEVMMCAAHNDDLEAAREQGMRTAYINRPTEYGADQTRDFRAESDWDIITDHIGGIADLLGS
jgi:2-haloacid dehalogenase